MVDKVNDASAPDGGAPYLSWNLDAHDLDKQETNLLQVLGAALLSRWFELPREIQAEIFDVAARDQAFETDSLREKLARFLHENAQ